MAGPTVAQPWSVTSHLISARAWSDNLCRYQLQTKHRATRQTAGMGTAAGTTSRAAPAAKLPPSLARIWPRKGSSESVQMPWMQCSLPQPCWPHRVPICLPSHCPHPQPCLKDTREKGEAAGTGCLHWQTANSTDCVVQNIHAAHPGL